MNAAVPLRFLQSSYLHIQQAVHSLFTNFPLAKRICKISLEQFVLMQKSFVVLCGVKELAVDRVHYQRAGELLDNSKRYSTLTYEYILSSHKTDREFYEVHGVMFTCSGIVGVLSILYKMSILNAMSDGLFTFSNFVALKYHAILFHNSSDPTIRKSAAIGIVSNLGYILSSAMVVIGYSATMALLFGVIAVSAGGIKILYDVLLTSKTPGNLDDKR